MFHGEATIDFLLCPSETLQLCRSRLQGNISMLHLVLDSSQPRAMSNEGLCVAQAPAEILQVLGVVVRRSLVGLNFRASRSWAVRLTVSAKSPLITALEAFARFSRSDRCWVTDRFLIRLSSSEHSASIRATSALSSAQLSVPCRTRPPLRLLRAGSAAGAEVVAPDSRCSLWWSTCRRWGRVSCPRSVLARRPMQLEA